MKEVHTLNALDFTRTEILALLATSISLIAIALVTMIALRQRTLLRRYRTLFSGDRPSNLDELLARHADQLSSLQQRLQGIDTYLATLESTARKHLRTPGIVRFRAFTDTGSDLSFSIALLDQNQDGIVISSLYGRAESRVYAKPIKAGQSTYTLSEEERAALQQVQKPVDD